MDKERLESIEKQYVVNKGLDGENGIFALAAWAYNYGGELIEEVRRLELELEKKSKDKSLLQLQLETFERCKVTDAWKVKEKKKKR